MTAQDKVTQVPEVKEVPPGFENAHADAAKYREMYQESITDPEKFWGREGKRLDWITPYTKVKNTSYDYHNVSIKWFEDGTLNVSANCVDRHVATRGDQPAIIWEGDEPDDSHTLTTKIHRFVWPFGRMERAT